MACTAYHCKLSPHSRSNKQSATAGAAYRAGERIVDKRTGIVHDYTRRRGIESDENGEYAVEIIAPKDSPEWVSDRSKLWNESERVNDRVNSTVAREFKIAFPAALDFESRREMVRAFSREIVDKHGIVVDYAMHLPAVNPTKPKESNNNFHAHVLMSTFRMGREGFTEKSRELDAFKTRSKLLVYWRGVWADKCANALAKEGFEVEAERWRYGHLTKEEQVEKARERGDIAYLEDNEGQKSGVHIGAKAAAMEKRGIKTERGDEMRGIEKYNAEVVKLRDVQKQLKEQQQKQLKEQQNTADKEPTKRELLQRDINADTLRKLVKAREPIRAVKDPSPQQTKLAWQKETSKQFDIVSAKAKDVYSIAQAQLERQELKLNSHDENQPKMPSGLFSGLKKTAYEKALETWSKFRTGLSNRYDQLHSRVVFISDYMRKSASHEPMTKGERLAEKKATKAQPLLARKFKEVEEAEKQKQLNKYREKVRSKRMTKEQSGRVVGKELDAEQQQGVNEINAGQSEALTGYLNRDKPQSKEDMKREMLEKFKEKAARDRSNEKDRGR